MSIDWKNKIKGIDFRHGLDRLYFVATLVWLAGWFIAFLGVTFDEEVNLYTNSLPESIWAIIFLILFSPPVVYIFLILVLKVFFWIVSGFGGVNATQIKVKIFSGDASFFGLIRKYKILLLATIVILISSSIVIAFSFTSYSSYEERRNSRSDLQFNFGYIPPLRKLPSLPKLPYIPIDER